jgi:hypothetical protein
MGKLRHICGLSGVNADICQCQRCAFLPWSDRYILVTAEDEEEEKEEMVTPINDVKQRVFALLEFDIDPKIRVELDNSMKVLNIKQFRAFIDRLEDLMRDDCTMKQRGCIFIEGEGADVSPLRTISVHNVMRRIRTEAA